MPNKSIRINSDDIDVLPEYSPLNVASIAALGLAAPGCLGAFYPAFMIFPVLSIGIGLFALARSRRSSSQRSGQRVARLAVFLSVLLICCTITLHALNSRRELQYAAHCVDSWLQMLRGEGPHEAFLLTLAPDFRPANAEEVMPTEIRRSKIVMEIGSEQDFYGSEKCVVLSNPETQIKWVGLVSRIIDGKRAAFKLAYDVRGPESPPVDYLGMIELRRSPGGDGVGHWQIGSIELIDKQTREMLK